MPDTAKTLRDLNISLRAKPPEGDVITDAVLYRWYDGKPDTLIVAEAQQCMENILPFEAHGKQWRVTYCELDEIDCFAVEGVEWR